MNHQSTTKNQILNALENFTFQKIEITGLNDNVNNMAVYLDRADLSSVVFYQLNPDDKSMGQLITRYKKSQFSLLILNRMPSEELLKTAENILILKEDDFLSAQKVIADIIWPTDFSEIKIVGITGTNGKTTVANLAMEISNQLGFNAVSIGTLGIRTQNGKLIKDFGMTTPPYIWLRKFIYSYGDEYNVFFIETSSHALHQNRFFDLKMDVAAWTNLTQDHLDYHGDMEQYFLEKCKIINYLKDHSSPLVIPYGEDLLKEKILKNTNDLKVIETRPLQSKSLPLFYRPEFNKKNLSLAIEINKSLFGEVALEKLDINKVIPPSGRYAILEAGGSERYVIIDYAHTPDALENILKSLREDFKDHQLICLFGCGGDRDRSKRALMGKVAEKWSDKIFLTSDNPRTEDPDSIIEQIIQGVSRDRQGETLRDPSRARAISISVNSLENNSVLLIAGKGHEEYQEINNVKNKFSDFEEVKLALKSS
jgi:UDP-N-acetylmuramoyl-L-alanyl-D-glutamate--2,6-diaminopimelate ligase